jgi:3-methyladenine DNA glycosylase AlkC
MRRGEDREKYDGAMAASKKPHPLSNRKGATKRELVPVEVKEALERGEIETANLVEGLTIDFDVLLQHVAPGAPRLVEEGIVKRMREAGGHLPAWKAFAKHPSDTVRGWAAYKLAASQADDATRLLLAMKTFAADAHFGVREWAWMAARPVLAKDLEGALAELTRWSCDANPNVRRFASEVTRPRGVWCAHLEVLKREPARGLALLEPLRSDPSKYVRDSVANWLNDASKSDEAWVRALTTRWLSESNTKETKAIVTRALRSLSKETGGASS